LGKARGEVIFMGNYPGDDAIPLGFGMALAHNAKALDSFAALSHDKRRGIVEAARKVRTKDEMQSFVNKLANQSFQ
ncbi:MAG: hypothetical protein RSB53_08535, partial [Oscillospiraceae bacterium]